METPEDDITDPVASASSDAPEDTEAGLRTVGLSFVFLTMLSPVYSSHAKITEIRPELI
jgi:hypothetical protein